MAEQIDLFEDVPGTNADGPSSGYDADDIQVLEGLVAVRKRPGMYIGSTSSSGLHHLVWEIVDNAVDEHLAKYCTKIDITLNKDGSVTVLDNGRGIPTGMHKTGIPTPQVVYTILHAGGKFGGSGYKKSGGLHGVGASVTNALSEWLEVEIYRDGKIHRMRFEYWVDDKGIEHVGEPVTGLEVIGNTNKTGTKVTFKPDIRVFTGGIGLNYDTLAERLQEIAFLNSGLKVTLKDERVGRSDEFFTRAEPVSSWSSLMTGRTCCMMSSISMRSGRISKSKWRCNTMQGTPKRWYRSSTPSQLGAGERMKPDSRQLIPAS